MIADPDLDRLCFFFDVDGTLIDLAEKPDLVKVPPTLKASLEALDRKAHGAVALVSGRSIATLDQLFAPLRLRASGVHGAEIRFEPHAAPIVDADNLLPINFSEELAQIASEFPGTLVENKRFSAAVHYRLAPDAGPVLKSRIVDLLARNDVHDLRILPGHMVFDLKRATFDKGRAIDRLMQVSPFLGRRPVFLGDDVTDEPGFAAVMSRGGFAFSIGRVLTGVSGTFPHPQAVRDWVSDLATMEPSHA